MHATAPPNREVSGSAAGTDHRTGHRTPRTSHPTSILTAAPTAISVITRHRSDPRVAHLVAGRCRRSCLRSLFRSLRRRVVEVWLRGWSAMKSFWSMPRTVSWRSRRSPWAAPRPARPGQERRAPLYGRHVPMSANVSHRETHQQHTRHICERIVYIVRIATIRNPIPLTLDHGFQAAYTTTR